MKFRFMAKHREIWPVRMMCQMLEVSASGFYEWLTRPESARARADRDLLGAIRTSFIESRKTYGSPRVWLDLYDWGYRCSVHRVARLMRQAGIQGRARPRKLPVDIGERAVSAIAPNVLDRRFSVEQPNRSWLADFTYVPTGEGWLFVAVVLDLCSRRVVGWAMRTRMTAELVIDALLMAIWRRGQPRELLHHSDQGSQYTSEQFQQLLAAHGVTCSMSRRGDVWDNSPMESFFSSMKIECVHRQRFSTRDQAKAELFDYIERFYNPRRRHSTLGGISPMQFEKQFGLA
jgi:putative transposase